MEHKKEFDITHIIKNLPVVYGAISEDTYILKGKTFVDFPRVAAFPIYKSGQSSCFFPSKPISKLISYKHEQSI